MKIKKEYVDIWEKECKDHIAECADNETNFNNFVNGVFEHEKH